MEAIHLAQEAIITSQREEIEALKKTVKTYEKKYKFLLDCFCMKIYDYGEKP